MGGSENHCFQKSVVTTSILRRIYIYSGHLFLKVPDDGSERTHVQWLLLLMLRLFPVVALRFVVICCSSGSQSRWRAVVIAKQYHDEFFLSEQLGPIQPTFQVMSLEGAGP